MKHSFRVITLLSLCATQVNALDDVQPIRHSIDKKLHAPAGAPYWNGSLTAFEKDLAQGAFDDQAENLLAAADKFTKAVFNFPSLALTRAVTRRDAGDVLVVEWKVDEPFAKGSVFLRDDPVLSLYEFRLSGCGIQSKDDVLRFLSKLLVWNGGAMNMAPESLNVRLPAEEPIRVFHGDRVISSGELFYIFSIGASARAEEWLINVSVGKNFTKRYYPVPPYIPERFPPLTELVKSWGFRRIWNELGTNPMGEGHGLTTSQLVTERDPVLIAKLVERGLSDEQIVELLRDTDPANLDTRASLVFRALENAGKQASIKSAFPAALAMYEHMGPVADRATGTLLLHASLGCAPEYESHALRLLKSGVFQRGALSYLNRCSTSEETLHFVETLSVPDKLAFAKEDAERHIHYRIGERQRRK